MRKLILSCILIILTLSVLIASESPVRAYLSKPSLESYATAVEYLNSLDQEKPEAMQAKLNLAYIANHEARRLMDMAVQNIDKLSPGERFSLANMYLGMDKYPEAIKIYDGINEANPKWSCPWRHKGEAHYKAGDYAASARALESSIETNREHYDAYVWYAKALYKLSRYAEAKKALDTAMELDPEEEDSHFDEELPEDEIEQLYQDILKQLKK